MHCSVGKKQRHVALLLHGCHLSDVNIDGVLVCLKIANSCCRKKNNSLILKASSVECFHLTGLKANHHFNVADFCSCFIPPLNLTRFRVNRWPVLYHIKIMSSRRCFRRRGCTEHATGVVCRWLVRGASLAGSGHRTTRRWRHASPHIADQ